MLSAQDLRLTFNPGTPIETKALRGLSLEIPTGQFVTVIGSNGAGKSTFLNSVSGDQRASDGRRHLRANGHFPAPTIDKGVSLLVNNFLAGLGGVECRLF